MPREPRGGLSSSMSAIGWALIGSGKDYEAALVQALGPGATTGRLAITEQQLAQALGTLRVDIAAPERRELQAFFKDRQGRSGSKGTVELGQFLEAVGLPAQTIGAAAA